MKELRPRPVFLFLVANVCAGCGIGTLGIASSGGGGGAGNAAPVGSSLRLTNAADDGQRPIASPATLRFDMTDEEGDSAEVEVAFATRGSDGSLSSFRRITQSGSEQLDLSALPPNRGPYAVKWDFESDLGDARFREDVALRLTVTGGTSPAVLEGLALGNDAPSFVTNLAPPVGVGNEEPSGNIDVRVRLSDSAGDRVDIRAEYDVLGDNPDEGFILARSSATPTTDPTPEFAFTDLETGRDETTLTFRWDSAFAGNENAPSQLRGREVDVVFRFTANERLIDDTGASAFTVTSDTTQPFRVDNNKPPRAVLEESSFTLGVKDRGNIPIRFRVFDEEADEVDLVVQWRAGNTAFPDLPNGTDQLRDLIMDPARSAERLALQIAAEAPPVFRGRLGGLRTPLQSDTVRLPELSSSAANLLAPTRGLIGRTLEILRAEDSLTPLAWPPGALDDPAATLLLGDGRLAHVLDAAAGGWRLRILDAETGTPLATLATGTGKPRDLSIAPGGSHLFVASTSAVFRLDRHSGERQGKVDLFFGDGPRAITALGSRVALATGDGELARLDFETGNQARLVGGLSEPWGVALDPTNRGSVLVAERGLDRVIAIDLHGGEKTTLPASLAPEDIASLGPEPLPSPRAIAVERGGARLLALCSDGTETSLRSLDLRSPIDLDGSTQADPYVRLIAAVDADANSGLSVGVSSARTVTSPSTLEVLVAGGIEQRRIIESYDPEPQVAGLAAPLDPFPSPGARWRIATPLRGRSASGGELHEFVWDSSEVPDFPTVQVRVLPLDADIGAEGSSTAVRPYRSDIALFTSLPFQPQPPGGFHFPQSVVAADMDQDGDLDLVSANDGTSQLKILMQEAPRTFELAVALPTGGSSSRAVVATDLNGDGNNDLAVVNEGTPLSPGSQRLKLFFQGSPGNFATSLEVTPGVQSTSVDAADLDQDGDTDLVTANLGSDDLSLFFLSGAGSVDSTATVAVADDAAPSAVAAGDLDGDGDSDLVSANSGTNDLALRFQTTPGFFPLGSGVSLVAGIAPSSVTIADLDRDGDNDIACGNAGSGDVTIYFQGLQGFSTVFTPAPTPLKAGSEPSKLVAADIDSDGDNDLVTANLGGNLTTHFQTSPGVFRVEPASIPIDGSSFPTSVAAEDIDGDGDVDLVSANVQSHALSVLLQSQEGELGPTPTRLDSPFAPVSVAAADLDGDGDNDLVSANRVSDDLALFFQTAPGLYTSAAARLSASELLSRVEAADLDGDGDIDLIAASRSSLVAESSGSLELFFQTEPGVFQLPALTLPLDESFSSLDICDLDGDGDNDIAVAMAHFCCIGDPGTGQLAVFIQSTPGTFVPTTTLSSGPTFSVAAADLDGDGLNDLTVSTTSLEGVLSMFVQDPLGGFSSVKGPSVGSASSVLAVDVDLDGRVDLQAGGKILFQTEPNNFGTTIEVNGSAVADFDGDGYPDLLSIDPDLDVLELTLQASPRVFAPSGSSIDLDGSTAAMRVADLDGDGDLDIVTANSVDDDLSLFFNGD